MNWSHALPRPIDLDDARRITTLAQARDVVLSAADFRTKDHWQTASRSLLIAAETGAPDDLARACDHMAAAIDAERGAPASDDRSAATAKATTRAERAQLWIKRGRSVRKPKPDA